jgi:hypothetical protein
MRTKKPWPAGHTFRDVGEPIGDPDFKPRAVRPNPEQELAAAFVALGKDYGGVISPLDVLARRLMLGQQLGHDRERGEKRAANR